MNRARGRLGVPALRWTAAFAARGILAITTRSVVQQMAAQRGQSVVVENRPGQLNVTNPSAGSAHHLGQERLFGLTAIDMQNVMYKTRSLS